MHRGTLQLLSAVHTAMIHVSNLHESCMAPHAQNRRAGLVPTSHAEHSVVGRAMGVSMHGSPQGQAEHTPCVCWIYHPIIPPPRRCKFWLTLLIIPASSQTPLQSSKQHSQYFSHGAFLTCTGLISSAVRSVQAEVPEQLLSSTTEDLDLRCV